MASRRGVTALGAIPTPADQSPFKSLAYTGASVILAPAVTRLKLAHRCAVEVPEHSKVLRCICALRACETETLGVQEDRSQARFAMEAAALLRVADSGRGRRIEAPLPAADRG